MVSVKLTEVHTVRYSPRRVSKGKIAVVFGVDVSMWRQGHPYIRSDNGKPDIVTGGAKR